MALVLLKRYSAAATLLVAIQEQRQDNLDFYLLPLIGKSGKPLKRRKNFEVGEELRRRELEFADQMLTVVTTKPELARSSIEQRVAATRESLKLPPPDFELPDLMGFPLTRLGGNPLAELRKL